MLRKAWLYVIITCLFELLWVYGFNTATTMLHWAVTIVIIGMDFYFLSKACEYLPTGTVYAIFAGVGTIGTSLMDIFLFEAAFKASKMLFIAVILIGVIGLKMADNKAQRRV